MPPRPIEQGRFSYISTRHNIARISAAVILGAGSLTAGMHVFEDHPKEVKLSAVGSSVPMRNLFEVDSCVLDNTCLPEEVTTTSTTEPSATTTTEIPPRVFTERVSRDLPAPRTESFVPGKSLGMFESTCYNLKPKGKQGGWGSIAVDPRVIPMGTPLVVSGYDMPPGYNASARDTGGAIKGRIIDVWMSSAQACRNWGRRMVEVFVGVSAYAPATESTSDTNQTPETTTSTTPETTTTTEPEQTTTTTQPETTTTTAPPETTTSLIG